LTALVAAITLHALLLNIPLSASKNMLISNGLLHVDLLQVPMPTMAQAKLAVQPAMVTHEQAKLQKKTVETVKKRHIFKPPAAPTVVAVQQHKPALMRVAQSPSILHAPETHSPAPEPDHSSSAETTHAQDDLPVSDDKPEPQHSLSIMAAGAQSMLLASIHYPPMARRHGWQGVGEFQLDIDSQSIRNITILVSTGYDVLDRAVRRGLASIEHVPVADGQYRLPVEFRLQ